MSSDDAYAAVREILSADPVCGGRVSTGALNAIAAMVARVEPSEGMVCVPFEPSEAMALVPREASPEMIEAMATAVAPAVMDPAFDDPAGMKDGCRQDAIDAWRAALACLTDSLAPTQVQP